MTNTIKTIEELTGKSIDELWEQDSINLGKWVKKEKYDRVCQLLKEAIEFVQDRAANYYLTIWPKTVNYKHRRVIGVDGGWEASGEEELACSECHRRKVDGHNPGCGVGAAEAFLSHPEVIEAMKEK